MIGDFLDYCRCLFANIANCPNLEFFKGFNLCLMIIMHCDAQVNLFKNGLINVFVFLVAATEAPYPHSATLRIPHPKMCLRSVWAGKPLVVLRFNIHITVRLKSVDFRSSAQDEALTDILVSLFI